jgi:uncharacterized tellurite resistance protein B-like protein
MDYKLFYTELGKLLYAIADADKNISRHETDAMKKLINNELIFLENSFDEFHTDTAYYAQFEFEYLDETIAEPLDALESFLDYLSEHKTELTRKMLLATKRAAVKIAEAHYKVNNKENKYLFRVLKAVDEILAEKQWKSIF